MYNGGYSCLPECFAVQFGRHVDSDISSVSQHDPVPHWTLYRSTCEIRAVQRHRDRNTTPRGNKL